MKAYELHKDLRVEYVAKVKCIDYGNVYFAEQRQFIGYVKKVFRKWFKTYVMVCNSRSRRIDIVPIKNIIGKIDLPKNDNQE